MKDNADHHIKDAKAILGLISLYYFKFLLDATVEMIFKKNKIESKVNKENLYERICY